MRRSARGYNPEDREDLLLLALYVATSAPAACAECAWVLWVDIRTWHDGAIVFETQRPLDAYATKAECDQALWRDAAAERKWREANPSTPTATYHTCLPDTVDPRGPKSR